MQQGENETWGSTGFFLVTLRDHSFTEPKTVSVTFPMLGSGQGNPAILPPLRLFLGYEIALPHFFFKFGYSLIEVCGLRRSPHVERSSRRTCVARIETNFRFRGWNLELHVV